ncbi:acyltransferase [Pseudomonas tussilaginis]|uniref:acyltransferase family protein n=1 Tax=unclassified Pseudomonas TaxID=196821 RepID=UPI00130444B5|nr:MULTISPECIES: acyltransferase [unclassified Pseudomonas]QYX47698.1 acyltransferase [Pseudomonas sp. S11A 273]
MESNKINYIPGLDGVRAVSVALVIFFHYASFFPDAFSSTGLIGETLGKIFSIGWIGVDIFFVISGYLIATTLIKNPISSTGGYAKFIKKRFLRLIPTYAVCAITFLSLSLIFYPESKIVENQYSIWTLSSNIPTVWGERSPLGGPGFTLVHFWSLAVEWHFYITFPIAMILIRSARNIAILAIIIAIASRVTLIYIGHENFDNAIYAFTTCRGDALACGVFLATLKECKGSKLPPLIGLIGILVLLGILYKITKSDVLFKAIPWLQIFGYTLIALSVAMVIYSIINSSQASATIRALESKPFTAIGRSSYSLYIWHLPLYPMIVLSAKKHINSPTDQLIISASASLLATAIFGALSYRYIELRFMRPRPARTIQINSSYRST